MATKIHMDVDQLREALRILNQIPSDLEPGGGASVSDLKDCVHINEALQGFGGNGGNADSWISSRATDLYNEINQHVSELKAACQQIGSMLDASIRNYSGTDNATSSEVQRSGYTKGR
jgi:hypothetical protein